MTAFDLSSQLLYQTRSAQDFRLRPACSEYGRVALCEGAFEGFFNLIESLFQVSAAEHLKQVNGFCNCDLRLLGFSRHDV